MKKVSCNIIRDILPLYIEGVVSDETREEVKAHLESCGSCRKEYQAMTQSFVLPEAPKIQDEDERVLKGLKRQIQVKRRKTAVISAIAAAVVMLAVFLGIVLRATWQEPVEITPSARIGDYILEVEEIRGDSYNLIVAYSLRRLDGGKIDPTIRFFQSCAPVKVFPGWSRLFSSGGSGSGGYDRYEISEDGKTLWILSQTSFSRPIDDGDQVAVTFEDLLLDGGAQTIAGTWQLSFVVSHTAQSIEVLKAPVTVQDQQTYQLTGVQLSDLGLHMDLKTSQLDITAFGRDFSVCLILGDGEILAIEDSNIFMPHHVGDAMAQASYAAMFDAPLASEDVIGLLINGQRISVKE